MLFRSNDTATTEIYTVTNTLSLHDALPIWISTFAFAYIAWVGSRPVVEAVLEEVPVKRTSGQRKTIARPSLGSRELE